MVRVEPEDLQAIAEAAVEFGLTAYDAAYVHYARARGSLLVTGSCWRRLGVSPYRRRSG
ncbi:PIN domain-containing protein [Thermofilum pendens]|uniref:type II toxin-antitoxin system VapC family toxin n=1 Tax=Thermofilum pendens TaxID=2269 RepID=UPI0011E4E854|nr:type II toxin-antitoxin system VapC family toxin [Thermofilum pendens]